jgi:glutamate racemase
MILPAPVNFSELTNSKDAVMILDSGAGAHSIYEACKKLRPQMNYVIIEDKTFFPYGDKKTPQLEQRFSFIAKKIAQHQAIAFIVACNTASTHALDIFRASLDCPVIGTVPPIKVAVASSTNNCIALLATSATINSSYTAKLIKDFAPDSDVHLLATPNLAELCETYHNTQTLCHESLRLELQALNSITNLDTIALGCTHYHLIKDEISSLYPNCQIIDCSTAIAKQFDRVSPQISKQNPTLERCYI